MVKNRFAPWEVWGMRTAVAIGITVLAVGGCAALPPSVQIASWALDGLSYIVSKKSVTDHGLSVAMQKDCALWRGLTEGRICHADGATTMIAKAEDTPDRTAADDLSDPADITEGLREVEELASLETAAGASGEAVTTEPESYALAPDERWIPGPYLTIEPAAASKSREVAALSELYLNVRF